MASKSGATIAWTSFNLPSVINGSGVSSQFWYGPDRQRFRQVANFTSGSETTHYVGGVLEKLVTASNTQYRHFIAGPSGLVAIYTRRVNANPTLEDTFYFTHDHQGNVDSITKADGLVQVRLSYDAFGKRRNEAGWAGPVPGSDWTGIANSSRRGYTEHEHLDNLGLIHMNGRVQDPLIGRFLSPDPIVEDPFDGQSFNRYSYVRNNPLTYVDPTGFCRDPNGCGGFPPELLGPAIAPDLRGTGVLSYTASVLPAYTDTSGRAPAALTSNQEVDHRDQQTAQVKKAASESEGVATRQRQAGIEADKTSEDDSQSGRNTSPAWPTNHHEITSPYSESRVDPVTGATSRPHRAIDVKNPNGDPVYSILDGKVAEVGSDKNAGNYVKVDHKGGMQSSYAHTKSAVSVGDSVSRGQTIGTSDGSGRATGPHLHLTIKQNGKRINPCTVLSCPP